MTKLNITGVKPGSTSLKLTAGTVTKNVPVTVKSRNLLSYGPAEGNGLTATVNSDGSLHITGTASKQWAGVAWVFPCPVQGNVTLRTPTSITGLSVNVKFLDAKGACWEASSSPAKVWQSLQIPSACASKSSPPRPHPP